MINVRLKSNFILLFSLIIIGCHDKEKSNLKIKKTIDTTKGFFVEYPYKLRSDYIEINKSDTLHKFELYTVYTLNDKTYYINSFEIPLKFDRDIDNISLFSNLDEEIKKGFNPDVPNSLIIRILYGKTSWYYSYKIDNRLILKDIYYFETQNLLMANKREKNYQDYIVRFPINEFADNIDTLKIFNINRLNWRGIKDKEEKYIIKR